MSSTPLTYRFLGPKGAAATLTFNNRTYSVAANGYVDVPAMDSGVCAANGWIQVAGSGTTAQRPSSPFPGQLYHDNTVGNIIVFEGTAWRNPASGAVA
jgi:hypothetical protein